MSVAANTFPCLYELSDIMSLFLVVARVILCACAASAAVIALPSHGNARYNYTSAKKEHPDSQLSPSIVSRRTVLPENLQR